MAKKRLTIGVRVRHKKNGASDGVIRSSLGKGKWMIKWSDKEEEEQVNSRSLIHFEEVVEESSSSSSDDEGSHMEDASSGESEDEHARKSDKFDSFAARLVGNEVTVRSKSFFSISPQHNCLIFSSGLFKRYISQMDSRTF